ncbi:MAG: serine/threonine protein kinase [Planctomycetes bacterium]|nr:serine/threonine protein kinase [Planctomycetota bacterium]
MNDDSLATRLFVDYVRRREAGETLEAASFVLEAGAQAEPLLARIRTWEEVHALGQELRDFDVPPVAAPRQAPERVGRYIIEREIDKGGSSLVLLARDPELQRTVALKVLSQGSVLSARQRDWLLHEGRSLARLDHPGVLRIHEVASIDGYDLVATEHVDGPPLSHVIAALRERMLPPEDIRRSGLPRNVIPPTAEQLERAGPYADALRPYEARVKLLRRLGDALTYCHGQGVVHRDVKPANVLLRMDERGQPSPVLIDFGLAHAAALAESGVGITTVLMGTAAYVAPEQIESGHTGKDPRSDQFAFGVIAYELLALWNPFLHETHTLMLNSIARAEPVPLRRTEPLVPAGLELIVHRALARLPDERYPELRALVEDLDAYLGHRPLSVQAPGLLLRLSLWQRRHHKVTTAAALVALGWGAVQIALQWRDMGADRDEIAQTLERARRIELTGPSPAVSVLSELLQVQRRTQDLSERWLAGDSAGELQVDLLEEFQRWRDEVEARVWGEVREARQSPDLQRNFIPRWHRWGGPLAMSAFLPAGIERAPLERLQELGKLDVLPTPGSELRWLRNGGFTKDPRLQRPELIAVGSALPPGQYRFESLSSTGAVLAQRDHRVGEDYLADPLHITLRAPAAELLSSMQSFRPGAELRGEAALAEYDGDYAELGGELWILPEPVRVHHVHEFLNADPERLAYLGIERAAPDDERRVCLPRSMLEAACNYYGMRLPSLGELHAAFRGRVANPSRSGVTMEALCGAMGPLGHEGICLAFRQYESLDGNALASLESAVLFVLPTEHYVGVADTPGELETLGRGFQFRFAFGTGLGVRGSPAPPR